MDLNLLLSAQTLHLARDIKCSEPVDGLIVLKNVPARTYLRVTPEQWLLLLKFQNPTMIPAVLNEAIRERQCLPMGEFYEVILKALRARILLEPEMAPEVVTEYDWRWSVSPRYLETPLLVLLVAGLVLALVFVPRLPASAVDALVGVALWVLAPSLGEFISACMLRATGAIVYGPRFNWLSVPPHFTVDAGDAVMLRSKDQKALALSVPAVLAATTGFASWHRPEWAFFPLLGLALSLRPIMGGAVLMFLHVGKDRAMSDAEHSFLFPPNRNPRARSRLLRRAIAEPKTWAQIAYGMAWALAILYWFARLAHLPTWDLAFWKANGVRVAAAVGASLVILGAGYVAWETFRWIRERASAWRRAFRLWRKRWFGGEVELPESSRLKVLASSPLFGMFQPAQRLEFSRTMKLERRLPWRPLPEHSGEPTHLSIITSGRVAVRRRLPSGKSVPVQVLSEGDVIGLHDLADPVTPDYQLSTRTPVTLLTIERAAVDNLVAGRIEQEMLADAVLKIPFLRRIPLCRNWHVQAVRRFARLSTVTDFVHGDVIVKEGEAVEEFFVIFQGAAKVSRHGRPIGTIRATGFFGEIGLLQNSSSSATVISLNGTRCLRIQRAELLRFVTHNYTVALELERVSSERLGRPIFPLRRGDFRSI